ncbi:Maf family protein [Metabacillus malikii]|uniref:dTTP/UTP pyrophosphatase n=1 Tax=Metabacillus malikii TaxID=1504265 RepID=A0ABT9ZKN0_9BACI|nr:Maf family protein [Metabacillus malikii]MDQ0232823.1 septum formation protein [Metabacillus malikii]
MTSTLILASASPRRKELLELLQVPFKVMPSDVDEIIDNSLHPKEIVQQLAKQKAEFIADKVDNAYVIGSDTIVAFENQMLGKPKTEEEAIKMLHMLSGNTHEVYTGVSIVTDKRCITFCEKTEVTFYPLSAEEINQYVATGEPMDKAGAYGIQGYGALLVEKIVGDYYAVVGLPIAKVKRKLRELGYYEQ